MKDLDLIARLQPTTDADAARLASPGARADLARQITGEPAADRRSARARRSRRWLIAVPAAVGLAAAALAVTALTSPARPKPTPQARGSSTAPIQAQALSFTRDGGYIDVIVRDPLADPTRYRAEFRAHGLDISIKLVPVSPSLVGTLVYYDMPVNGGIKPITAKGKCFTGGGACPVGVRVPLGFKGTAHLVFGRAAQSGEQYDSAASSATDPGESLAGQSVVGNRVADVAMMMRQRHVTAVWVAVVVNGRSEHRPLSKVPGTWYVYEADPWAPGQVALWAGATVTPQNPASPPSQPGPSPTPGPGSAG